MEELLLIFGLIMQGKITVVANDGNDVEPVEVDRLIIGVSETYDIVVTIPEKIPHMNCWLHRKIVPNQPLFISVRVLDRQIYLYPSLNILRE